jgi:precorrin-8X/cobalt-precorrin-8 methylmutase
MASLLDESIGIVAIGNAPTALLQLMKCIDENPLLTPDLVVGVPVGFVNAAESKELLSAKEYPYITSRGRKGGSPVAAAVVNAILRMAASE